jgi:hypothetical protein
MTARARPERDPTRWRTLLLTILVGAACVATVTLVAASSDANARAANDASARLVTDSTSGAVNPLNFYQHEPAPVGIADFGIGANGAPYSYNTTSFLGSISILRLEVNSTATGTAAVGLANTTVGNSAPVQTVGNTFLPVDALGITFQLNVVLAFEDSGQQYAYWIQDVAGLTPGPCYSTNPVINFTDYFVGCTGLTADDNSTAGSISFEDNVWNFSAPDASMESSTISGNGSVSSFDGIGYYAASASETAPGNDVTINYPTDVQFRVDSLLTAAHIPEVVFQYSDGSGWQTFDNPTFPFATDVTTDNGYEVNGYTYNPEGLYYDAELTMGGAGDGTYSGMGPATNLYMTESYYNGHNYEAIPSAYNFGSDTAESVDFVQSSAVFSANGQVGDQVLGGGSGSLHQSYNSSELATVDISTPASTGTVSIGNNSEAFSGGTFVQRVGPDPSGPYAITVTSGASTIWAGDVSVVAGETVTIDTASYFAVMFTETGLLPGANWELTVGTSQVATTSSSLTVFLENGKYSWTATASGHSNVSGTLKVSGKALTEKVTFKASK